MTTGGEGGMVVTDDEDLWKKAWSYKDHGKDYDSVFNKKHPPGFRWLVKSFGTNYRMTEMQAAIGRVMLRKLDGWVERRRRNATILAEAFLKIPALRVVVPPDHIFHAFYKYYAFVKPEMLNPGWDRERVIVAINEQSVPCFSGSCSEIYLEKAFEREGLQPSTRLPVAKVLGETSLMFLVHPTLSEQDMHRIAEAVHDVFSIATP